GGNRPGECLSLGCIDVVRRYGWGHVVIKDRDRGDVVGLAKFVSRRRNDLDTGDFIALSQSVVGWSNRQRCRCAVAPSRGRDVIKTTRVRSGQTSVIDPWDRIPIGLRNIEHDIEILRLTEPRERECTSNRA